MESDKFRSDFSGLELDISNVAKIEVKGRNSNVLEKNARFSRKEMGSLRKEAGSLGEEGGQIWKEVLKEQEVKPMGKVYQVKEVVHSMKATEEEEKSEQVSSSILMNNRWDWNNVTLEPEQVVSGSFVIPKGRAKQVR